MGNSLKAELQTLQLYEPDAIAEFRKKLGRSKRIHPLSDDRSAGDAKVWVGQKLFSRQAGQSGTRHIVATYPHSNERKGRRRRCLRDGGRGAARPTRRFARRSRRR